MPTRQLGPTRSNTFHIVLLCHGLRCFCVCELKPQGPIARPKSVLRLALGSTRISLSIWFLSHLSHLSHLSICLQHVPPFPWSRMPLELFAAFFGLSLTSGRRQKKGKCIRTSKDMCRHVVHLCTSLSHRQHFTLESGKLSVSQARMHHASRFSDRFSLSACLQETNRSCCAVWDFYSILFFQRLGSPEFSLATSHLCLALGISIDGRFKPVLRNNVLPSFRQMVLSKPLNSFDIIYTHTLFSIQIHLLIAAFEVQPTTIPMITTVSFWLAQLCFELKLRPQGICMGMAGMEPLHFKHLAQWGVFDVF